METVDLERRCCALVIDCLLLAAIASGVALLAWPGVMPVVLAVLLAGVCLATLTGALGVTPGKAVMGARVVDPVFGRPVGVPRALLRTALVGLGTVPTGGFGLAALALTALADPSGRRRGWHDQQCGTVVVDARRGSSPAPEESSDGCVPVGATGELINLTALRLAPAPLPALAPRPRTDGASRPGPEVRLRWQLHADTGERIDVRGASLIGRRLSARTDQWPGEWTGSAVTLLTGDKTVSKLHARCVVTADGALVFADAGSRNGSYLTRGGLTRRLEPGEPTTLRDGDRLKLGDRELTVVAVAVGTAAPTHAMG